MRSSMAKILYVLFLKSTVFSNLYALRCPPICTKEKTYVIRFIQDTFMFALIDIFFKKNMYFKVGIVGTIQQKANNYDG